MNKWFSTIGCGLAALTVTAALICAQGTGKPLSAPATKPAKAAAATTAKTAAPKADAEIQKCTQDRLAGSKLKDNGFAVAVSGGTITLSGTTKVAGHKGVATQFAKRCGATTVTNNITVEKAAKSAEKKP